MEPMLCAALVIATMTTQQEWKPVEGNIMTRWASRVDPANPLPDYPRPTLVRPRWKSLNGMWDYAVVVRDVTAMPASQGQILVPFPIESALSGVKKPVKPDQRLWYRREFEVSSDWGSKGVLHFDAVDFEAEVWLNGERLGDHRGGYDRFSFEVPLKEGRNELVVAVWDPTDTGTQPRGKQVLNPESIWYTAVTGIWQTVWVEPVGDVYIRGVRTDAVKWMDRFSATDDRPTAVMETKLDIPGLGERDRVFCSITDPSGLSVGEFELTGDQRSSFTSVAHDFWTPNDPKLYKM